MDSVALVTGGAGFLGSHLCERLLEQGKEVICLDNFYTGSKNNIRHLLSNPHFELIRHDIWLPIYLSVSEIYNLACPASPIHYQNDPIGTVKTNVLGAINMLGMAKRCNAPILHASTSEVYGDPAVHPQVESYFGNVNPVGPRACYDEGKRCAETLCVDYATQSSVEVRLPRIFNTYGPRMHPNDGRVVSNFILQALKGEDITIYGDGSQTRSFCFVDDLLDGFMAMMDKKVQGPLNLGNPTEITIKTLASMIIEKTNSNSKLIFQPLPQDDPMRRKPDITLAKEKLGWDPKVDISNGLDITIEYFIGTYGL